MLSSKGASAHRVASVYLVCVCASNAAYPGILGLRTARMSGLLLSQVSYPSNVFFAESVKFEFWLQINI